MPFMENGIIQSGRGLTSRHGDSCSSYFAAVPKVLAAEYRTVLPDEKLLAADLEKTRRMLERRGLKEVGSE